MTPSRLLQLLRLLHQGLAFEAQALRRSGHTAVIIFSEKVLDYHRCIVWSDLNNECTLRDSKGAYEDG